MDDTFDDKSGSDRSDCTDLSDDEDDDFDSESESSGDESDIVVPLMDVGASPSRHARIFPGSPGHRLRTSIKTWLGPGEVK